MLVSPSFHLGHDLVVTSIDHLQLEKPVLVVTVERFALVEHARERMQLPMLTEQVGAAHYSWIDHPHTHDTFSNRRERSFPK